MEQAQNKQYVIYPHENNYGEDLNPQDKLIYLAIRRYMNKQTMESFPSYSTLNKDIGANPRTIKKSVNNLIKAGYLEIKRNGKYIKYVFNNKKHFEAFSYEFLDKKDLSFTEKAYIVSSQQYMFKDETLEEGRISYSTKTLSELINMPESTIKKCNRSLQEKGYLEDSSALTKVFKLRELDQLIIFKLKEHEDRLNNYEKTIQKLQDEVEMLKQRLDIPKEYKF